MTYPPTSGPSGSGPQTPPYGQPAQYGAPAQPEAGQFGQAPQQYGQPQQYAQPAYGQAPYGHPGSAQPGSQPAYGQPGCGQAPQGPYGQPMYGQPPYGQPMYGPPGYGQLNRTAGANAIAGILLLVGVIIALLACFLPNGVGSTPLLSAFENIDFVFNQIGNGVFWMVPLAPFLLAMGALICLSAGVAMFSVRPRHAGAAGVGMFGSALLLVACVFLIIGTEGRVFDYLTGLNLLALTAWIPALLGSVTGLGSRA